VAIDMLGLKPCRFLQISGVSISWRKYLIQTINYYSKIQFCILLFTKYKELKNKQYNYISTECNILCMENEGLFRLLIVYKSNTTKIKKLNTHIIVKSKLISTLRIRANFIKI